MVNLPHKDESGPCPLDDVRVGDIVLRLGEGKEKGVRTKGQKDGIGLKTSDDVTKEEDNRLMV
ncbi:hypothetical protein A2U01_0051606, partial [Trifolium medium]|nr:hypothetical protein [Trifolium medium]